MDLCEVNFCISKLFNVIQVAAVCTGGAITYIYMYVSVYWCCVSYVCLSMCMTSNQSSAKNHIMCQTLNSTSLGL